MLDAADQIIMDRFMEASTEMDEEFRKMGMPEESVRTSWPTRLMGARLLALVLKKDELAEAFQVKITEALQDHWEEERKKGELKKPGGVH